jgi:endonuclease/exonuclease/phosphatase (EEP) superfamily protein YafD
MSALRRLALAGTLVLAALWLAHLALPDAWVWAVLGHALAPWWAGLAWPLFAVAAWARAKPEAVATGVGALAHLVLLWPIAAPAPAPGPPALRVVVQNVFVSNPEPERMLASLAASSADVLALIELDRDWWKRMANDPRFAAWPHRVIRADDNAYGIGLLSRLPLRDGRVLDTVGVPRIEATVEADGAAIPIAVVHLTPPYEAAWIPRWQAQLDLIANRARAPDAPWLVVGDLNTTVFNPSFQRLRDAGFTDAAERAGRRAAPTWPNEAPAAPERLLPPLLGLDHALLRRELDLAAWTLMPGPGSDHRGVEVVVQLTNSASSAR